PQCLHARATFVSRPLPRATNFRSRAEARSPCWRSYSHWGENFPARGLPVWGQLENWADNRLALDVRSRVKGTFAVLPSDNDQSQGPHVHRNGRPHAPGSYA
ncbi:hypothetical protein ACCS96_47525, partial [Rhizobium ruizarguesonis]